MDINPGDQVALRSGGVLMTVEEVDAAGYGTLRLVYWAGALIQRIDVRREAVQVFRRVHRPAVGEGTQSFTEMADTLSAPLAPKAVP